MKRIIILIFCLVALSVTAQTPIKLQNRYVYQTWRGDTLKSTLYGDSIVFSGTSSRYVINYDSVFFPKLTPSVPLGLDVNGKMVQDTTCYCTLHAKILIPHDSILVLNTQPKVLIPAVPGHMIFVESVAIYIGPAGVITPYGTNYLLDIITNTRTPNGEQQMRDITILLSTVDRWQYTIGGFASNVSTRIGYVINQPVIATIETGNPTGGAAGQYLIIDILYRLIP